jgi:hypothetical protein
VPIGAITGIKRPQIELGDSVDHKPGEMPLRQPLAQARRQQQLPLAVTPDEVLRHPRMVLTRADRPLFTQQPRRRAGVSPQPRWLAQLAHCDSQHRAGETDPARPFQARAGRGCALLHRMGSSRIGGTRRVLSGVLIIPGTRCDRGHRGQPHAGVCHPRRRTGAPRSDRTRARLDEALTRWSARSPSDLGPTADGRV